MRPRIFISHSAHEQSEVDALAALEKALHAADYDVLVDRTRLNQQPGVPWRDAIGSWLEICDGAVVLFSEAAKASHWVQAECAILKHRWRRSDCNFKLFIGILNDMDPKLLGEGFFEAVKLDDSQVVRFTERAEIPSKAIDYFAPLKEKYEDSPAARRRYEVLRQLQHITDRTLLARAARALSNGLETYSEDVDRQRGMLVDHMMQARLKVMAEAIVEVITLFEQREAVFALLEPGWVCIQAIDKMVKSIPAVPDPPMLLLRTSKRATAESYLTRCEFYFPTGRFKRLFPVNRTGEVTLETLIEHLVEAIADRMGIDCLDDTDDPEAEVRNIVSELRKDGFEMVVVLWAKSVKPQWISDMRARLGPFTFLLLGQEDLPGLPTSIELDLSQECERDFLRDRCAARALISLNK